MNRIGLLSLLAVSSGVAIFAGCSKDPPPAAQPTQQMYAPGQPGYTAQPGTGITLSVYNSTAGAVVLSGGFLGWAAL